MVPLHLKGHGKDTGVKGQFDMEVPGDVTDLDTAVYSHTGAVQVTGQGVGGQGGHSLCSRAS